MMKLSILVLVFTLMIVATQSISINHNNHKQQQHHKRPVYHAIQYTTPISNSSDPNVSGTKCGDGSVCPSDNTCCLVQGGVYACCPTPQGTCCSDGQHCCPQGFSCGSTGQICIPSGNVKPYHPKDGKENTKVDTTTSDDNSEHDHHHKRHKRHHRRSHNDKNKN